MTRLNIKEWTAAKKLELAEQVRTFIEVPHLAIIQVGYNEASIRYIRNKVKDCEQVGIQASVIHVPEDISLINFLIKLETIINNDKYSHLIIQKPLPPQLEAGWDRIIEVIPPEMDIDGFTSNSIYKPCTPYGIIEYLKACNFIFDGADAVVIGRSNLVGKPLAQMLLEENATVTICHSHTKYLQDITHNADLVVVATGKAGLFDAQWAPFAQFIVDVGINFDEEGHLVGDVRNPDDRTTPVPGGVGLLTRWALLDQIINGGK